MKRRLDWGVSLLSVRLGLICGFESGGGDDDEPLRCGELRCEEAEAGAGGAGAGGGEKSWVADAGIVTAKVEGDLVDCWWSLLLTCLLICMGDQSGLYAVSYIDVWGQFETEFKK